MHFPRIEASSVNRRVNCRHAVMTDLTQNDKLEQSENINCTLLLQSGPPNLLFAQRPLAGQVLAMSG